MTQHSRLSRRRVLSGGAGLAAAATLVASTRSVAAPALATARPPLRLRLPAPSGPYPVGTTSVHMVDRSRHDPYVTTQPYREMMVSITYPARDIGGHDRAGWLTPGWVAYEDEVMASLLPAGKPVDLVDWSGTRAHSYVDAPVRRYARGRPVLLYLLGHWASHCLGRTIIEDLASRGYVVVAFDPTHETPVEFPGGRIVRDNPAAGPPPGAPQTSLEFLAYIRHVYRSRLDDARFVLGELAALNAGRDPGGRRRLPRGLPGALDLSRVGAFGGGIGAGLAGLQLMYEDRRVRAAFAGDSGVSWTTGSGSLPVLPVVERGLDRPVLVVNPTSAYANPDPLWDQMWHRLRGWRRELELRGGGSMWFTDAQTVLPQVQRGLGLPENHYVDWLGTVDPARAVAARRAYLAAFFDLHLRRRDSGLLDGPSPRHPVIRFVR